ncbi:photosystem I assembly protein Ycf3 [Posidoniimonas polymericola]|uniref:Photosystem I assembly protein Ycf3 n=1 Tax=Posidoniimonas polymericola TaxID=2528002 RepID=A0A5C5ZF75_9BACT|nr:tetratricopeptide repeat protein [Posidoniimonas polymericola]TWT85491.1 photosystem I assembly protein Ycf3 [Posidoniimonas polymericola]
MDAKRFSPILVALAALNATPSAVGEPAALPSPVEPPLRLAQPVEPPRPLAQPDEPAPLALPRSISAAPPRPGVHDAFDLERPPASPGPLPPVRHEQGRDDQVHQTSLEPESPRRQQLLALYNEAERMAGRGRSAADLTDLIERCELAAERLGPDDSPELTRLTSWAYNRRGELHAAANQPRDAFADFQHAVVLDDQNAPALVNRGVTLAQYGKTKEALADFSAALAHDPRSALGYRNRAELLAGAGQHDRAINDYNNAIALHPADPALHAGRGFAQAQLGRYSHAVRDYSESLRLMPGDADTLVLRANAYAEVGYYEQAVADLDAALALAPASASAYQSVAWLLSTCPDARFRDPAKAVESARRALRFGAQGDPWLLDVAAAAYAGAGHFEEAIRIQQQAAMLAPLEARRELQQRLALYQQGQPYRQPPVRTAVAPVVRAQANR